MFALLFILLVNLRYNYSMMSLDFEFEETWKLDGTMRILKDARLKVPWAKQLRRMKRRFKRDHQHPSWQMAIQSHIDAAHGLVQLANVDPSLLHDGLCLYGMRHGVKGIPRENDLREKWKGYSHSKVAGRKVNTDVKSDEYTVVLALPVPDMEHYERRKQRKKRMLKKLSSFGPKLIENHGKHKAYQLLDGHELTNQCGKNGQKRAEVCLEDCHDRLGMLLIKKRKRTARSHSKRETVDAAAPEICTLQTGLSFSVIHLLIAVQRAMVAPQAEDNVVVHENDRRESIGEAMNEFDTFKDKGSSDSVLTNSKSLPLLTIDEIVERVRSTPMHSSILQTKEPLLDLVRGVLKIFSSETAPLGVKLWKPLTFYHKPSKCWSWIGPVTINSCNAGEEDLSSENWSLKHNILWELVDSFAIWLKFFQERPSQVDMQPTLDESEKLKDGRCFQPTISPSSEEVRADFQKEEGLRYLVPDKAFFYTALDGRKSAVAPLGRYVGEPLYRGQNHCMLKGNRPPRVNIRCLVRDAAARLPESSGTRADMCTLIRDSQFVAEEISDEQLGHAATDALELLHDESDPCVKFDTDRRLWLYLHGKRGKEDFEDGGRKTRNAINQSICS